MKIEPVEPTTVELSPVTPLDSPLVSQKNDEQKQNLTRELTRRQRIIQRLGQERDKALSEINDLRQALALSEEVSLISFVTELQEDLTAALKAKEELMALLNQGQNFRQVTEEELEAFWPTLQLDQKSFMSKRRQQRLLKRMRAEKMQWLRTE